MDAIEQLLRLIFSEKCQLQYLRLDISEEYRGGPLHECLSRKSSFYPNSTQPYAPSCCVTLRQIDIRLNSTSFLLNLIAHVPNLEELSVELISLVLDFSSEWHDEASWKNDGNWLTQVRKKIIWNFSISHPATKSNHFSS